MAIPWLSAIGTLIVSAVLYGIWRVFIYPDYASPLRRLPMPPPMHPWLGHAKAKFESPNDPSIDIWMETIPNDGLIRVKNELNDDAVIATSPEMLKTVLVDNAYDYCKAPGIRRILRLVLGDGLVVVEGEAHRYQKKRLLPHFGSSQIKDLYPLFWEKSSELVKLLSAQCSLDRITFGQWCSRVTLDIIGVAALGKDFGSLTDPDTRLLKDYKALFDTNPEKIAWFILSFWLPKSVVANIPFWSMPKTITRITNNLHQYAFSLAADRRKEIFAGLSPGFKADSLQLRRPDILSQLVQANELTDSQLADQVLTFLAAGHETTSATLAWATVLLSQHPQIQADLRAEIRANLPSPDLGETASSTQFERLPLLNAVCHETLRLYPTVCFTARLAIKPTRLGDILLHKGVEVWLSIWAMNRSPRFWGADAADFRPSRWITNGSFNNNGGAPSNYAQLTFVHGPRSCVGQGFARAELRCLVAAVIGRFQVALADDDMERYRPEGLITIKPDNDCVLNMTRVKGW